MPAGLASATLKLQPGVRAMMSSNGRSRCRGCQLATGTGLGAGGASRICTCLQHHRILHKFLRRAMMRCWQVAYGRDSRLL